MYRMLSLFFMAILASSSAIVVQDNPAAEAAPAEFSYWNYVYNYKGASGVAVGGPWLLTAAHVAKEDGTGELSVGGSIYSQQQIIYHDGTADLALIRYDKPFPEWYALYPAGLVPDLEVRMVGFGTTGTVSSTSWTDSGAGAGVRRWGSQLISGLQPKRTDTAHGSWQTESMRMEFDLEGATATAYEAGAGTGDSGGGVFINDNGYKLAGIMISTSSGGLVSTFSASIPQYSDWVVNTIPDYAAWAADAIPEPQTLGLMSLSTISLFFTRSMRRRRRSVRSLLPGRRWSLCDTFCSLEDWEAGFEAADGIEFLSDWMEIVNSRFFTVWSRVCDRYTMLGKRIWNRMEAAYERRTDRAESIKSALMEKISSEFDVFDQRFWARAVDAHERWSTRRKSIKSSLKKKLTDHFDALLARIMK